MVEIFSFICAVIGYYLHEFFVKYTDSQTAKILVCLIFLIFFILMCIIGIKNEDTSIETIQWKEYEARQIASDAWYTGQMKMHYRRYGNNHGTYAAANLRRIERERYDH